MEVIRLSEEYVKAVEKLYYWQHGQHFFTADLFALMAKADTPNFAKLAVTFPVEAKAFSDWYHSQDPFQFFQEVLGKNGVPNAE